VAERKRNPLTLWARIEKFLVEIPVANLATRPLLKRLHVAGQFLFLTLRGFVENRCPTRAAALSYTTLLALIPLVAVALSISKNFLHDTSADFVPKILDRMMVIVSPQLELMGKQENLIGPPLPPELREQEGAEPEAPQPLVSEEARQQAVRQVQSFIDRINAGALGTLGTILLIFVGIRLLMTVEQTFNDVWGVQRGRSLWRKVVYYWTTITLGPLLLLGALAVTGSVEFSRTVGRLQFAPWMTQALLQLAPFAIVWVGFALMYKLMPNTRVKFSAALAGGIVGGTLWQVNGLLSTLYIAQVVKYSKIYGALGIIPIFLLGLYFSWLIVLFGAQVSFVAQNWKIYFAQKKSERVDQEGRELLACRVMLEVARSFAVGAKPPTMDELTLKLNAPLQLLNQVVERLIAGGIIAEVADERGGLLPARALDSIRVADVAHVMRCNGSRSQLNGESNDEPVAKLLAQLHEAENTAAANQRFSDLVR
jgi:membrane protein